MFEFTCYQCYEKFNVRFENLSNKISIVCPNCGNPLPQKTVEHLRNLSEIYMDVTDSLYQTNSPDSAWGIRILETKESIPKDPDKFFFNKPEPDATLWKSREKPFMPKTEQVRFNSDDDLPF